MSVQSPGPALVSSFLNPGPLPAVQTSVTSRPPPTQRRTLYTVTEDSQGFSVIRIAVVSSSWILHGSRDIVEPPGVASDGHGVGVVGSDDHQSLLGVDQLHDLDQSGILYLADSGDRHETLTSSMALSKARVSLRALVASPL